MTSPDTGKPRTTLAEVARAAGVSLATASKVVNGRPDVALETRAKVEEAIRGLQYSGRTRKQEQGRQSVAFLADVINSPYAMEVLRGAVLAAEELDVDVVVERTHQGDGPDTETLLTQRLLSRGRSGAIVLTSGVSKQDYAKLIRARLPMVVVDPLESSHPDVTSIGSTNWMGGRSVAEHLISLGHERIGIISGPAKSLSAMARLDGLLSAWAQAGKDPQAARVEHVAFDAAAADTVAAGWLRSEHRPTAIATGSDAQAMGVLQAAREAGLTVPDDLSIVGYDDTALAALATPPLTVVRQPLADMGAHAMATVLGMARGEPPSSQHIEIATSLVVRSSTAPPRRD